MPEMRVQQPQQQELTAQQKAKANRLRLVRENNTVPTVKVWAGSEALRRVLRHPNGTRFRGGLDQPVEWPYDNFTHRRVMAGDVSLSGAASGEQKEPDPSLSMREQAYARRPKPEDVPPVRPLSALSAQERAAEEKRHQPQQQPPLARPSPPSPQPPAK
jgi:hypothetical protein